MHRKITWIGVFALMAAGLLVFCPSLWAQEDDDEGAKELAEKMKAGEDEGASVPQAGPQRSDRVDWWTDARFGMFLCWAPAAKLEDGWGGWTLVKNLGKNWDDFDRAAATFNPTDYDPDAVAKLIKRMGAEYVVFTAKHHEGYAMWDTQVDDYKITNSPYGKDILRMHCDALRDNDLRVGIYFSKIDWHRPEFRGKPKDAPGLGEELWGVTEDKGNEQWPDFMDFYFAQAEELLSNYGPVDIFWLDGWRRYEPMWEPEKFFELCRKHQPAMLLNDRFGDPAKSDFTTPESHVPAKGYGRPWESCITSNGSWYYKPGGYRSTQQLVRMLIGCVAKNGNLLLNFALNPQGTFDDDARQRMEGIGAWMAKNSASIYECGRSPLRSAPWGRSTAKPGHIYLHLYPEQCNRGDTLLLEGLQSKIDSVKVLATGEELEFSQDADDAQVTLPAEIELDEIATVIDVEYARPLKMRADFIRQWTVLEPMPGHSQKAHACQHDFGIQANLDTTAAVEWQGLSYDWTKASAQPDGYVDLAKLTDKPDDAVTYVAVDVLGEKDTDALLLWGSSDVCELYLNGTRVARTHGDDPVRPDADKVPIRLGKGRNTLVAKVYNYHGGPFGFFAWIARARQLGLEFQPATRANWIGGDPCSWEGAATVIEAEQGELHKGTASLGGNQRDMSGEDGVRVHLTDPATDGGLSTRFELAEGVSGACLLVRYGHRSESELTVMIDDGEPIRIALPSTGHPRYYRSAAVELGDLPAGEHTLRAYTSQGEAGYHLDAFVIAEGEPVGGSIRQSR